MAANTLNITFVKSSLGALFSNTVKHKTGDLIYIAIVGLSLLAWGIGVYILYRTIGGPDLAVTDRVSSFQAKMMPLLITFGSVFLLIRGLKFSRENPDESFLNHAIIELKSNPQKLIPILISVLIGAISFIYLQVNFMSVKTAIPTIQPFYFDDMARRLDRLLFLGQDPWVYFSWLYNIPYAVKLIDISYTLWSTLIVGFWIYAFATSRISRQRRFQYILSMMIMWFVAGNLLAILLSSAGPCYYFLFGSDPNYYAGLMSQLSSTHAVVPIDAYTYQDILLSMYNNPETRFGGISAAPSLHVGTSLLLLAFFWKHPVARYLLILFNIIIYIGSIILAWHYAIDGLIVVPVAFLCWVIAGKITRVIEGRWPSPSLNLDQSL
ncbi:MAG: phosphatase PAP2 family protein [Maricaulaceae bacterium]